MITSYVSFYIFTNGPNIFSLRVAKKRWLDHSVLSFGFKLADLEPAQGFEKEAFRAFVNALKDYDTFNAVIKVSFRIIRLSFFIILFFE